MTVKHNRVCAWLELCRLSNAPTVVTNVMVGVAAASGDTLSWITVALVASSMLLFYVAGMALNDAADVESDAKRRPERPIPSRRISRRSALIFVVACFVFGIGLIAAVSVAALVPAAALITCIVVYNALHKKIAWSVLLMGACRGLVYFVAVFAVEPSWRHVWLFAAVMTAYIVVVTAIARRETESGLGLRGLLAFALPVLALAPFLNHTEAFARFGAAIVAGWLLWNTRHLVVTPARTGRAIMGWLAGICLIDGFFLLLLEQSVAASIAGVCFILTIIAHRFLSGT